MMCEAEQNSGLAGGIWAHDGDGGGNVGVEGVSGRPRELSMSLWIYSASTRADAEGATG
jgi:hypothetical protein